MLLLTAIAGVALAGDPVAWVLDGSDPDRAERVVQRLERLGGEAVPLARRWCVLFPDGAPEGQARRVERVLGEPPEERFDCHEAWYPPGTGWLAYFVAPPAQHLEQAMAELAQERHLTHRALTRPLDVMQPAHLCLNGLGLDPLALVDDLEARGLDVIGVYAVGGCQRR